MLSIHMSNEENLGCLGYIGDYTTQFFGDYNKLAHGTLLNNQYNGMSKVFIFFFVAHMHSHVSTFHCYPRGSHPFLGRTQT